MKHRLTDHSGYLIIDHTNSPGIKESEIPDKLRLSTIVTPEGKVNERDVQFCSHCGTAVIINPLRTRPRSYCAKCDHYICDNPICNKTCSPLKKLLDTIGG